MTTKQNSNSEIKEKKTSARKTTAASTTKTAAKKTAASTTTKSAAKKTTAASATKTATKKTVASGATKTAVKKTAAASTTKSAAKKTTASKTTKTAAKKTAGVTATKTAAKKTAASTTTKTAVKKTAAASTTTKTAVKKSAPADSVAAETKIFVPETAMQVKETMSDETEVFASETVVPEAIPAEEKIASVEQPSAADGAKQETESVQPEVVKREEDLTFWTQARDHEVRDDSEKKDRKKFIILIAAILALLALGGAGVFMAVKNSSGAAEKSVSSERQNTIELAKSYIERGNYDQALSLLNGLVIKESLDDEIEGLLDRALELKNRAEQTKNEQSRDSVSVSVDASGIEDAMQSSIDSLKSELAKQQEESRRQAEANAKVINDLLEQKKQEEQKQELQRKENERIKKIEEQKKADEEKKKADEEKKKAEETKKQALAAAAAQKLRNSIDDESAKGKALLNAGDIAGAMKHFDRASSLMPKDDDPQNKEFVSSRMSDMAKSLYAASENSGNPQSDEAKAAALSYARETLAKDPSDAASHYIFGMQALESKNYAEAEKQLPLLRRRRLRICIPLALLPRLCVSLNCLMVC